MEVKMTEIILLVIAFELLMAMSLSAVCITIYVLGHKKQGEKQPENIPDEFIEGARKRAEKLQKQFENMMSYTGRERVDED